MLTFFRRIRKGLLEGGRTDDPPRRMSASTSKYLLYAIGEVLLVMIGILLALQVNNWNDSRKAFKQERNYLERLHFDLQVDSTYFTGRLNESSEEIDNYYTFIHDAQKTQRTTEEFTELWNLIMYSSEHLTIQNSTYLEMINTGNLDIVRNNNLRVSIVDLYRRYETIGKHIQEFNEYSAKIQIEASSQTAALKYHRASSHVFDQPHLFRETDWLWINDQQSPKFQIVEEAVAVYSSKHKVFIGYFEQLIDELEELLRMIEVELN